MEKWKNLPLFFREKVAKSGWGNLTCETALTSDDNLCHEYRNLCISRSPGKIACTSIKEKVITDQIRLSFTKYISWCIDCMGMTFSRAWKIWGGFGTQIKCELIVGGTTKVPTIRSKTNRIWSVIIFAFPRIDRLKRYFIFVIQDTLWLQAVFNITVATVDLVYFGFLPKN